MLDYHLGRPGRIGSPGRSATSLEPVRKVARMIKKHLEGIVNAIVMGVTNADSESINANYFHYGGLDIAPQLATYTKS